MENQKENNKENPTKTAVSVKDICENISGGLFNLVGYFLSNISHCIIQEEDVPYIELLNGLQIFSNNFVSSFDNLKENKEDGIKFKLEGEDN